MTQEKPLLTKLRHQIEQGFQPTPLGQALGCRFVSLAPGEAVIDMPVQGPVMNSMNYLHGGALSGLADIAMGFAMFTLLDDGEASTTVELKINFVRPVFEGTVRATGASSATANS